MAADQPFIIPNEQETDMATKATLTKAARARERQQEADAAFVAAIKAALADGHTYRQVAAAVGLSVGRVHQIATGRP